MRDHETAQRMPGTGYGVAALSSQFMLVVGKSFWGILAVSLITLAATHAGAGVLTAGLLFLACVVVQARRSNFWSAAVVAILAALTLAFFFSPPILSFSIARSADALAVLTFVVTAFLAAHMTPLAQLAAALDNERVQPVRRDAEPKPSRERPPWLRFFVYGNNILAAIAVGLLLYSLAWTYSTHRYLKGFTDAIVPLNGSPQQKTDALLDWLRHQPERNNAVVEGTANLRDPVNIVQNQSLLKICGSASNAFLNLANAAGLNARRLLLLQHTGGANHVVAEVQWDDRWVVVDPQHGTIFKDASGRALSKEDLRNPDVFQDAISRIPGYSPDYTFQRTAHVHLRRVPSLGLVRRMLDTVYPRWEEAYDWGYFAENPSLWPALLSLPLFLLSAIVRLFVRRYGRPRVERGPVELRETVGA